MTNNLYLNAQVQCMIICNFLDFYFVIVFCYLLFVICFLLFAFCLLLLFLLFVIVNYQCCQ